MDQIMAAHVLELVGRGLLALLFILAGITKITSPAPIRAHMEQEHVPTALLLPVAAFEIAAGAVLLIGWAPGVAAGALALFCVLTAVVFHRNFAERAERTAFAKDLALAGALTFVAARALA